MRHSGPIRSTALATLVLLLSSCVATQLPPISSQGRSFKPLSDETRLWEQSRDEEAKLLGHVKLYDDPLLESHLAQVVARLNPPGMAANPEIRYRVRVVEDPTLNAFAYPHGSIYIHTGLLARMENEDELATVLGHEMTHVEDRHMLRYQRSMLNRQIGLTVATIAAAVALAVAEGDALDSGDWGKASVLDAFGQIVVELGLELAFTASVNGYGRGLENEADEGGFRKMTAAGYDLREAPKVYQVLLDDRGEPRRLEAFFFGSHPRLSERVEDTKRYLAAHPVTNVALRSDPGGRSEDTDAFARLLRPVVRDDARLNLDLGRLKIAEEEIERARALMPEDPETHFLRGRLRLAQATDAHPVSRRQLRRQAEDAFLQSIELDPRRAAPHRELGILLYERDQLADACLQLRRYAELAPDADDLEHVEDRIQDLEREGHCR
ncbi:MAG TPA: M48 family metalloprotease [Thermoanaerobaculia bacterium]|jgi:predicted Zn-dependent protease|nr:M48 family metalloprotease [Thermoanaerobaculia bacterium]